MKILLAEDEKSLSNALVTILKHHNYLVDAVYNGEDASSYASTNTYDLLILDIMMPKQNGFEVLKTLRNNKNSIPVLILTAKSEIEDKVYGLELGADDYLTKPFNTQELLARIKALTRRRQNQIEDTLTFGNLSLNRSSLKLSNGKKELSLIGKEFQILELLMLNPNMLISTEKIMEKIWGYDSNTEINAVWTYISYLRQKIKKLNGNFIIKATRNIGYSLEIKND